MYVDESKENISAPLRREVRELRTEITHLRNAIQNMKIEPVALSITKRRTITTALIATLALYTVSCRSSKTVTQQTQNETVHDTLREVVTLTLHDTIRETTTITIQTNNDGDTTRLTTTTDREKITNTDRTATTLNHQTTQTTTENKTETTTTPIHPTSPIQPINPIHQIKPISISFLLGLLLIPLIKLCRRLKK